MLFPPPLLFYDSDPLLLLNTSLPPKHPIPRIVTPITTLPKRGAAGAVAAAELGIDGAPRIVLDEAVPDPDGDLGLRRAGGGAQPRLGRRGKQRRGPRDPPRLRLRPRRHPRCRRRRRPLARRPRRPLAAGLDWVDSIAGMGETDGRALWALLGHAKEWAGRLAVG